MKTLLIATHNPGKLKDFHNLIGLTNWTLTSAAIEGLTLPLEPDRTMGATLESNATLKAESLTGRWDGWVMADDSGLFVDALPNELGVDTALYGGPDRLLQALEGTSTREAAFGCVLALAKSGCKSLIFIGNDRGHIAAERRGRSGFGYDSVFVGEGQVKTNAERLDAGEAYLAVKRHRAVAVGQLIDYLQTNA